MKIKKINRMYMISFLFTLHIALSAYVNSVFLSNIISEKYIGILYTIASLTALILLTKSSSILKYIGNRRTILYFLVINMFSLFGLILSKNPFIISLSFITFASTNSLILLSLDIFIEHFGNKNTVGKTRGLYLTIINIAWMISPIISSYIIISKGSYKSIYILSFILTISMIISLMLSVKTFKDRLYKRTPFLETYKFLKENHHMLAITLINFILQFFYALMVIYTPIYLIKHIGLGWDQLGIIFAVMLSPFVLFSYPVGVLIDKYHIKKRTLLYIGILIMSVSTFAISQISTQSVYIWAFVLFLTRTGATLVESTSEIYFFTHIKEEDAYLLGLYRDMSPVAYILAPLLATILFLYLPFSYLYIILSIILLVGLYYIPKLKHNHEHSLSN